MSGSAAEKTGLFEGGGTAGSQYPRLTEGQRELLDALTGQLIPEMGRGVTPYPGQMVADISPLQQQGFDVATGMAGPGQQAQQYFQNMLGGIDTGMAGRGMGMAEQALGPMLEPFDPAAATEFWETSMKAPALRTWREDMMPSIMEKGVRKAGTADSGPMQRELARSGEDLMTNLSAQLGGLLYSGQQAQLGRQQQGVGQAMNLSNLPGALLQGAGRVGQQGTNLLSQMMNIGTTQRAIGQEGLTAEQMKWQASQPYMNPWLQQFLSQALGVSAFDTVVEEQPPSIASQLAPFAMAAGMMF